MYLFWDTERECEGFNTWSLSAPKSTRTKWKQWKRRNPYVAEEDESSKNTRKGTKVTRECLRWKQMRVESRNPSKGKGWACVGERGEGKVSCFPARWMNFSCPANINGKHIPIKYYYTSFFMIFLLVALFWLIIKVLAVSSRHPLEYFRCGCQECRRYIILRRKWCCNMPRMLLLFKHPQ